MANEILTNHYKCDEFKFDYIIDLFVNYCPTKFMTDEILGNVYCLDESNTWKRICDFETFVSDFLIPIISEDFKIRNDSSKQLCKKYQLLIKTLGLHSKLRKLSILIAAKYNTPNINDLIDSNTNIIAFDNCVYDLHTNSCRSHLPDDYIFSTTNYAYDDTVDLSNEYYYLFNIISNMFENSEQRDFTLRYLAGCLSGRVDKYNILVLIGDDNSGKGILGKMMLNTLGQYCCAISSESLSTFSLFKYKSFDTIGKRFLLTRNEVDTRRLSNLLQFCLHETIKIKKQHCQPLSFSPRFKIIYNAKTKLYTSSNEDSYVHYIRFPFLFTENPTSPLEKNIDTTIEDKMKQTNYRMAFFKILLNYYSLSSSDKPKLTFFNTVSEFINNCCVFKENTRTDRTKLYAFYLSSLSKEVKPISNIRFYAELRKLGINPDFESNCFRYVINYTIKEAH